MSTATEPPPAVLLAFSSDQPELRRILKRSNWTIHTADGLQESLRSLRGNSPSIVVCPYQVHGELPWKVLASEIGKMTPPPRLIVTDADADEEKWAEVLNLGAYDFLTAPLEIRNVFHVLACAWQSWHCEKQRAEVGHAA